MRTRLERLVGLVAARRRVLVTVLVVIGALGLVVGTVGLPTGSRPSLGAAEPEVLDAEGDPRRGLVYDGLFELPPDGGCGDGFAIALADGALTCTDGPVVAPTRVDVRAPRDVPDFVGLLGFDGLAGDSSSQKRPCSGAASDGDRIQAVYARAEDRADRYLVIAPFIAGWAAQIDAALGLRWVTDDACQPQVRELVVPTGADSGFAATLDLLRAEGFDRPDRKYVIWMDANVYCAISQLSPADVRLQADGAFAVAGVVRVDEGCWGRSELEVREVSKMLDSQPHQSFIHATRAEGLAYDWAPALPGASPAAGADGGP